MVKKILESPIDTIPWKRIEKIRRNFTKNKNSSNNDIIKNDPL
jgi:hypothetical protein